MARYEMVTLRKNCEQASMAFLKPAGEISDQPFHRFTWQFIYQDYRKENRGQWLRSKSAVFLLACLLAFPFINLSSSIQADEKPLLIEGIVKTSGPNFAWFVEAPETDTTFLKASVAIKEVIDLNGLKLLKNEYFAIFSHSNLIKDGKLDMQYLYFFKSIPGSDELAKITLPGLSCALVPLYGSKAEVINMVIMDFQPDQQDFQLNCYLYAIRKRLGLESSESATDNPTILLDETLLEMSKMK